MAFVSNQPQISKVLKETLQRGGNEDDTIDKHQWQNPHGADQLRDQVNQHYLLMELYGMSSIQSDIFWF